MVSMGASEHCAQPLEALGTVVAQALEVVQSPLVRAGWTSIAPAAESSSALATALETALGNVSSSSAIRTVVRTVVLASARRSRSSCKRSLVVREARRTRRTGLWDQLGQRQWTWKGLGREGPVERTQQARGIRSSRTFRRKLGSGSESGMPGMLRRVLVTIRNRNILSRKIGSTDSGTFRTWALIQGAPWPAY